MAIITEKSVVLLLVIGFLQVQARSTEFVFAPRAHIDSGQTRSPQILTASTTGAPKEGPQGWFESDEGYDSHKDDEFSSPEDGQFLQEEENDEKESDSEERSSDSDDLNSEEYSEESEEESATESEEESATASEEESATASEEESATASEDGSEENRTVDKNRSHIPLRRVRRRIIPVGGAAIDRSRGGRGKSGRSRSPWSAPTEFGSTKEAVINSRKNGPTGSAALFSLFPDLAPPGWNKKKGTLETKNIKNETSKVPREEVPTTKSRPEISEEKPQSDERAKASSTDPVLTSHSKKASKLSRHDKEEIAMFAERHGIERAVLHFKSRVDVSLRSKMVEKFLRRYQNRVQRRANRS